MNTYRNPSLYVVLTLFLVSLNGIAQQVHYTNAGYIAARTEELLDQAMEIVASGDKEAFGNFVKENYPDIIVLKADLPVYLVEVGFTKVKIRFKGKTLQMWTLREAIR